MPDRDVAEATINKRAQYDMATRAGMLCPQTLFPENRADLERMGHQLEYPAIIKPYYSYLWQLTFAGERKGFSVGNQEELIDRFENDLPPDTPVLVQSVIPGPNTNHYALSVYVSRTGEPLAIFASRKVRQFPVDFGVGTLLESCRCEDVVDLGLKLFNGIGFRGIGELEFKKDERDGRLKMIEVNPRLWEQNSLATRCGANFPLIEYLDLTGQAPAPQTSYRQGVFWLNEGQDFMAFWTYHKRGELSVASWLRSVARARSFSTFAWNDPMPFLSAFDNGAEVLRLPGYMIRHR